MKQQKLSWENDTLHYVDMDGEQWVRYPNEIVISAAYFLNDLIVNTDKGQWIMYNYYSPGRAYQKLVSGPHTIICFQCRKEVVEFIIDEEVEAKGKIKTKCPHCGYINKNML